MGKRKKARMQKKATSVYISLDAIRMVGKMADDLSVSRSAVWELAIRKMAHGHRPNTEGMV